MKSFFISLLCLLILLATWITYCNYSEEKIYTFIDTIEYSILLDIDEGNWNEAKNKMEEFEEDWNNYRKSATFFFETDQINDVDYSIAKSKYYIKSKEYSNTSGELSTLKEQLRYLYENELLTLPNLL